MGSSDNDSAASETPHPPLMLVDADGNEVEAKEQGKSYKYRDFSNVNEDDEEALGGESAPPPARNSMETSIRVQKFPVKLYAILAQKEFNEIITWMPHGRSWKVLKPNIFESMVMPLFFEYSNYHSFNRLVNAWSFRRVSSGPDRGSYYHELFLRGKPHLQKYMRRLPKTHKKLPMQKSDEPDFYRLDQTNPLPALEDAPIPGGLVASSAINGTLTDAPKPPVVSPSDNTVVPRVPTMPGRLPAPQAQRLGPGGSMYGAGLEGTAMGSSLVPDEFGDAYPQTSAVDQSLSVPSQPNMQQGMPPFQDSGVPAQMAARAGMLPSNSGAFRSTMAGSGGGLPGQRFPSGAPMPGMGMGPDSDVGNLGIENLRNAPLPMGHPGQPTAMNPHMNPMSKMGGQMNQVPGMGPGMGRMGAALGHMAPMPGMGVASGGYGDMPQQQQQQQLQRQMNMYPRDPSALYGGSADSMVGGMNGGFPDELAGAGMNAAPIPRSFPTGDSSQ